MSAAAVAEGSNELLELFTRYNQDWWPAHLLSYALGVSAVALVFARQRGRADRWITGVLAAWWLWLAAVFQVRLRHRRRPGPRPRLRGAVRGAGVPALPCGATTRPAVQGP